MIYENMFDLFLSTMFIVFVIFLCAYGYYAGMQKKEKEKKQNNVVDDTESIDEEERYYNKLDNVLHQLKSSTIIN